MGLHRELFQKRFSFKTTSVMLTAVYNIDIKKKNNELTDIFKSRLNDLRDKIEEMSEDDIETEKANKIVDIVETFLDFNK